MKKSILGYFKFLWLKKYLLIVSLIFFATLGYAIVSLVINPIRVDLSFRFSSEEEIQDYQGIISKDNLKKIIEVEEAKYGYIDYEYLLDNKQISITSNNNTYEIIVKGKAFKSITGANNFLKLLVQQTNQNITFKPIEELYKVNRLIGAYVGSLFSIITITIILLIYYINGKDIVYIDIADNKYIYRTPFHKRYWQLALTEHKKIVNINLIAILITLMQIVHLITLPSGFGTLGLSFGFLFFSIIGLLYGPVAGVLAGFISDIVGFYLFPPGMPFNILYTFSAMLSGLTYGLFFYKTKITFTKVLFARIIVNLFINGFLGSLWWGIDKSFTLDQTFVYMFTIAMPKNLVYLLPQSVLLFIVVKSLMPMFKGVNVIDMEIANNVTIF